MSYDVCKDKDLFPEALSLGRSTFAIRQTVKFKLGKNHRQGASGRIVEGKFALYDGSFGPHTIAIKINNPKKVKDEETSKEVQMQIRLFCHMERKRASKTRASIPETLFSATIPRVRKVIGMERVDESFMARLLKTKGATALLVSRRHAVARRRVCWPCCRTTSDSCTEIFGENVMFRENSVFLIDFGMANAVHAEPTRLTTDARYEGVKFNRHLDMLTLVTSLRGTSRSTDGTTVPSGATASSRHSGFPFERESWQR